MLSAATAPEVYFLVLSPDFAFFPYHFPIPSLPPAHLLTASHFDLRNALGRLISLCVARGGMAIAADTAAHQLTPPMMLLKHTPPRGMHMLSKPGQKMNDELLVHQSMAETSVYIDEIRGRTRDRTSKQTAGSLRGAGRQQADSR
jgi:hypothetical protein